jgi:hypothetical protein
MAYEIRRLLLDGTEGEVLAFEGDRASVKCFLLNNGMLRKGETLPALPRLGKKMFLCHPWRISVTISNI